MHISKPTKACIYPDTSQASKRTKEGRLGITPIAYLLVLLPVCCCPRYFCRALTLAKQRLGLPVDEEILLTICAHEEDAPAWVYSEAAEAARRRLQHHGCALACTALLAMHLPAFLLAAAMAKGFCYVA